MLVVLTHQVLYHSSVVAPTLFTAQLSHVAWAVISVSETITVVVPVEYILWSQEPPYIAV